MLSARGCIWKEVEREVREIVRRQQGAILLLVKTQQKGGEGERRAELFRKAHVEFGLLFAEDGPPRSLVMIVQCNAGLQLKIMNNDFIPSPPQMRAVRCLPSPEPPPPW